MARKSKTDVCLICDEVPCVCSGPPRAVKIAPRERSVPDPLKEVTSAPAGRPSVRDAMKARAAKREPSAVPEAAPAVSTRERTVASDDLAFRNAIQALAPILHWDELERYRGIISNPDRRVVSERARDWRNGHG